MPPEFALSKLEYEMLDTLVDDDETTAIILHDLRNPNNARAFSEEAKALDFVVLDAVFSRLAELGLVGRKQEATDGFRRPQRGVSFTWWCLTEKGRRAWEAWAEPQESRALRPPPR